MINAGQRLERAEFFRSRHTSAGASEMEAKRFGFAIAASSMVVTENGLVVEVKVRAE